MIKHDKKQEITGYIGYYDLADWWLATFSEQEHKHIQSGYDSSLAIGGLTLTQGEVLKENQSAVSFLIELSRWFGRKADRYLARAILEKAESLIDENTGIREVHVLYNMMIDIASREADPEPDRLGQIIRLCENHIFVAAEIAQELTKFGPLPKHHGFLHLATIRERERKYKEVISLCREAQEHGWAGDWGQRIKRCQKKLDDAVVADYGFVNSLSVARA